MKKDVLRSFVLLALSIVLCVALTGCAEVGAGTGYRVVKPSLGSSSSPSTKSGNSSSSIPSTRSSTSSSSTTKSSSGSSSKSSSNGMSNEYKTNSEYRKNVDKTADAYKTDPKNIDRAINNILKNKK